ncbi:MAG: DUF3237 domain-containing protein [Sphingomonadales bacterium]|nr:DUF3237 domain-containing protein [Sphingomonadales bacterium]MDE2569710.1 DUF3237 domain-containing protein [Sphingomonadales bacterium]
MAIRGANLAATPLCLARFEVGGGLIAIGEAPLGSTRMGYVTGGSFEGERLRGTILPGGGNWSRAGRLGKTSSIGDFDARAVWRTDDDALIYVTYTGRSVIPDDVRQEFQAPDGGESVDPSRYYLRIAPVFETAAPRYAWLNGVLAVGVGRKTRYGVEHTIYTID